MPSPEFPHDPRQQGDQSLQPRDQPGRLARRELLRASGLALTGSLAGCSFAEERPITHTVEVFNHDRSAAHDIAVTVRGRDDEPLYDRTFSLDPEKATEDNGFQGDPANVEVAIDGEQQFDDLWPQPPGGSCDGQTKSGVKVYYDPEDGTSVGGLCETEYATR